MAQCPYPECDKSIPGDEEPACTSCLLRPLPQEPSNELGVKTSEEVGAGKDLSYLSDDQEKKKSKKEGKSAGDLAPILREMVFQKPQQPLQENQMKKRRIYSSSNKNGVFIHRDLTLHFDSYGIAECDESELFKVRELMRHRPGRFSIMEDEEEKEQEQPLEQKLEKLREQVEEKQQNEAEKRETRSGLQMLPEEEQKSESESKPKQTQTKKSTKGSGQKKSTKGKSKSSN